MTPAFIRTLVLIGLLSTVGCGGGDGDNVGQVPEAKPSPSTTPATAPSRYAWSLPEGFPIPRESSDNPLTAAKIELGRHLFFDLRMSINQTMTCASCHQPARAFTDGRKTAIGATGEDHPRNAMSLTNVVYNSTFNWANEGLTTLHTQALVPTFGEFPLELGWSDHENEILDRFRHDVIYQKLFAEAYPGEINPFSADRVTKAIAAFESILISGNSPYDQSIFQGNYTALSTAARRGQELFFSERFECFHCHGGFNFSQSVSHSGTTLAQSEFHNNGLYNIGGKGDYPLNNRGLWDFTHRPADMGRFRAPTLRNIELTAPYMHDGSVASLEEALDHYARGGRIIGEGPLAGDGARNPYKSELIVGFSFTDQEKQDVIAFLHSLTDWQFICDSRFSDPFGNFPRHERCN